MQSTLSTTTLNPAPVLAANSVGVNNVLLLIVLIPIWLIFLWLVGILLLILGDIITRKVPGTTNHGPYKAMLIGLIACIIGTLVVYVLFRG